ncbi:MAG: hypothetical protein O2905_04815 [Proteobacteria bacterium]|nr:hypothetical protein [Pseudomonadota bacterium]MDA1132529.1 hypothetical protein [Pseudomonadota bacterium]
MKRSLLTAAILFALAAFPARADDDADRARVLSPAALAAVLEGYAAYQAGEHAAAVAAWEPVVRNAPHRAQYLYARIRADGAGSAPDPAAAAEALADAAAHGHAEGQYLLGLALWSAGDAESGIEWLHAAANQNWAEAHYALGQLFEAGDGVDQDPVEALVRYGLAIHFGHPLAIARFEQLTARLDPDQIAAGNARIAAATAP